MRKNFNFLSIMTNNSYSSPMADTKNTLCVIREIHICFESTGTKTLRMVFLCLQENYFTLHNANFSSTEMLQIKSCNPSLTVDGLRGNEKITI